MKIIFIYSHRRCFPPSIRNFNQIEADFLYFLSSISYKNLYEMRRNLKCPTIFSVKIIVRNKKFYSFE